MYPSLRPFGCMAEQARSGRGARPGKALSRLICSDIFPRLFVIAKTYLTTSEEETIEAGRDFAALITRPSLVLLVGDLGAGKTTFTKGIVGALAGLPPEEITSPTFTLVH